MTRIITLILIISSNICLFAQAEQHVINSKFLDKNDTILVVKPSTYQKSDEYPLVYLLHGFSESYDQWSEATDLQALANKYQMIFACPDGYRSWYINSPEADSSQYFSFFKQELKPFIHENYSIDSNNIFITGLSMGGYGCFQLFAQFPDYFKSFGSLSAVIKFDQDFDYSSYLFFQSNYMLQETEKIIGPKEKWPNYDVNSAINKIMLTGKPFLFDCGIDDPFYQMNLELKAYLDDKGANATFISQPGSHNNQYWGKNLEKHIRFFNHQIDNSMTDQTQMVIEYFERVDEGSFDQDYYNLFSDDVELYFPKFGYAHGKEGLQRFSDIMGKHLKSIDHDISDFNIMQSGHYVIVEGKESGITQNGVSWPDNKVSFGKFCNVFEFENGLISRVHIYVDPDYTSDDLKRINALSQRSNSHENLTKKRITIINSYFQKIDDKKFDEAYFTLFTDSVEVYFPKFGYHKGKEAIRELGQRFGRFNKYLDHDFDSFNYIPNGDMVVVEGQVKGETLQGEKWPDGKYSHGRFCNVFKFDGLFIESVHIYEDPDFTSNDTERIMIFGTEN